jgi:protein dithiol oxidoreductase (disulfide-forming)
MKPADAQYVNLAQSAMPKGSDTASSELAPRRPLLKAALAASGIAAFGSVFHAREAQAQFRSSLTFRTYDPVKPLILGKPDKIEVVQFFYYGCPHCFDMEPVLAEWLDKKPADVEYAYVPALRDEKWVPLTKAWYMLDALDAKRLHRPIYDNIHFDGKILSDEAPLLDWLARNGFERAKLAELYNSQAINAKVEEARARTAEYRINATPTMVVQGKYSVSSGLVGSHHEAMRLVDQFVAEVRKQKK